MKYVWRTLFVITGIFLLVLCVPHESPWVMKNVQSSLGGNTVIRFDFLSIAFAFSAKAMYISLALLFGGMILVVPSSRRCLVNVIQEPTRLIILLICLAYFAFTLKPSSRSWGMVLYQILSTSGLVMVLIGLSELIDRLISRLSSQGSLVKDWFLTVKAWKLVLTLFLITFILTNLACYFIFEHIPHIVDSVDQVFHGRIFLLGKLTVPSPEPRESFYVLHMINNGRWYSQYPPGHSLLFSLGHIINAIWIINPLFGSLCVALFYLIGKEVYDEKTGRLAALLGTLSPFLIFMSSGFMNHTTTLFFISLFILGYTRMMIRMQLRYAVLAGFALGYALNIRPMTAVAAGIPFAIYALYILVKSGVKQNNFIRFASLFLTALFVFGLMTSALLAFNYHTNGDPFLSGYELLHSKTHNPGFGNRGLFGGGYNYTPGAGLIQMLMDLNALNKYLFEMPIPALFFVAMALASPKTNIWDLLFISYVSSQVLAYFFYWFQCWGFGPRFMFETTAGLILLSARGISLLPSIFRDVMGVMNTKRVKGYLALVLIFCFILGYATNIVPLIKVYSNSYWGVNGNLLKMIRKMDLENALVFVKGSKNYESVFFENHPLLKSDIVYALYVDDKTNARVAAQFPDKKYYVADGNSIVEYNLDDYLYK
ncbi:hypothetical protein GF312_22815 [Candidatus Poribacteria bacterium]|nr:hypothetical protein [Candidatus Poribacteria bacterium]